MTWVWLFAWDASWVIFALLWAFLETKFGEKPPQQGGPGGRLELREVEPLRHRPGRVTRGLRPVRARRVHRR
jgi:hypothetical protein